MNLRRRPDSACPPSRTRALRAFVAILAGMIAAPVDASAATDGFAAGAVHLATELDHLLAIIGVSLLAATAGQGASDGSVPGGDRQPVIAAVAAVGLALAAGLATGALSGGFLPPLPVAEVFNQASIAVFGALLVAQPRLLSFPRASFAALAALVALVAGFAWCHGYAGALDRGGVAPPATYIAGVVSAALGVFAAINVLYAATVTRHHRLIVRVVGSWICAIGILVLAFHFWSE